jgi:Putative auto-transporter adhesin, head GIN domain
MRASRLTHEDMLHDPAGRSRRPPSSPHPIPAAHRHRGVSMRLRVALALMTVALLVTACSVTKGSGQLARSPGQRAASPRSSSAERVSSPSRNRDRICHDLGRGQYPGAADQKGLRRHTHSRHQAEHINCADQADHVLLDRKGPHRSSRGGSGSVRVSNLTTTSLSTKISGLGTITANGTVNDQDLEISGSGRYLADGMTKQNREGTHLRERYRERCRNGCA